MGDEHVREAVLLLQVLEEVDDLRLDRDVEGADGLVADDELRPQRERPRDADALALPAAELVREAVGHVRAQADPRQEAGDPILELPPVGEAVHPQGLGDRIAHGDARVQGGVRVLEDDLQVAAELAQARPVEPEEVHRLRLRRRPVEGLSGGRLDQPQQGAPGRGLATARLPHERQGLAVPHREVESVHGLHLPDHAAEQPLPHREVLLEAAHVHERRLLLALATHRSASASSRW